MVLPASLYLIKGKLYGNVVSCEETLYRDAPVFKVTYRRSDGSTWIRNQSISNVVKLPFVRTEEGSFRFRDTEKRVWAASRVHWYGNGPVAVCVESVNGYLSYGFPEDLSLEESLFNHRPVKVFDYLKVLSDISRMEDETGRTVSLRQKYDHVQDVFSGSMLAAYCRPTRFKNRASEAGTLVFPFGCNASQYEAVKNAMSGRLSFIQGPPGTGKTQTILNILANLLLRNKTCLVVSNNNSAVTNVVEKLSKPEYGLDFLVAVLGREANKDAFIAGQTGEYPDMSSWALSDAEVRQISDCLAATSKRLPGFFKSKERLACLAEKVAEVEYQLSLSGDIRVFRPRFGRHHAKNVYEMILRLDADMARFGKPSAWTKIKALLRGFGRDVPDRDALMVYARHLDLQEMTAEMETLKAEVAAFEKNYETFSDDSLRYLKAALQRRFAGRDRRILFQRRDFMSPAGCQGFLYEYPVVTSTTFSATTCINQLISFDCLIMDEASQVDIVSGALALNVALFAVIVGDQKQLPNVVSPEDASIAERTFGEAGLPEAYRYVGNSFLDSALALFPSAPVVLLREHYRCDPLIIGYCNRRFYDGKLVVMTSRGDATAVSAIRTVGGEHRRGNHNQRQAEEVVAVVRELLPRYGDIGVIAPYNDQVSLISGLLREAGIEGVKVATVHKFQGRENDVIVMSTVDDRSNPFVDDPHLLNVAVSRAKRRFVLICGGEEMTDGNMKALVDYIAYYDGARDGAIRSVFDLLYEGYAKEREAFIGRHKGISQYITEDIIYGLLCDITAQPKWSHLGILFQYPLRSLLPKDVVLSPEESAYANRSWTLVDFVLFDRVTHAPVLAIEVDGVSFHRKGTSQYVRDMMKDSVLKKAELPLLRLSTEGSEEGERIVSCLEGLL